MKVEKFGMANSGGLPPVYESREGLTVENVRGVREVMGVVGVTGRFCGVEGRAGVS